MNNFWLKQWLELGFKAFDAEKYYMLYGDYGAMKLDNYRGVAVEEDAGFVEVKDIDLKALSYNSAIRLANMVDAILDNAKNNDVLLNLADIKDLNAINKEIHNSFIKGQLSKSSDEGLERFRKSLVC